MKKLIKERLQKSVVAIMSVVLVSGGVLAATPTSAKAAESNVENSTYSFDDEYILERSNLAYQQSLDPNFKSPSDQMEIQGVKSKAVIKVGQLLRAGGDKVIDAAKQFNIIDSATAKTFKNNSKKIGNYLTRFENAGKDAAAMIRSQLPGYLTKNTRMGKGTAENISIAVSWAVRMADILFL